MDSPPPLRIYKDAQAWEKAVMGRLQAARTARGLSLQQAGLVAGLGSIPKKLEWVLLEDGDGEVAHLRLDQLVKMATAYRLDLRDALVGWPKDDQGKPPPVHPEPMDFPELAQTAARVRRNLRVLREGMGLGFRKAASRALGNPRLGPALYRLEHGDAPHLHMKKLWQLAGFYGVPVEDLILSDQPEHQTSAPTEQTP